MKIKIGDIVEFKTKNGYAYGQFTHETEKSGEVVRVFVGNFQRRPSDFKEIAKSDIRFNLIMPLKLGANKKAVRELMKIVGNEEISEKYKQFPYFKSRFDNPVNHKVIWSKWNGEVTEYIRNEDIDKAFLQLSNKIYYNIYTIIEKIENEYRPGEVPPLY